MNYHSLQFLCLTPPAATSALSNGATGQASGLPTTPLEGVPAGNPENGDLACPFFLMLSAQFEGSEKDRPSAELSGGLGRDGESGDDESTEEDRELLGLADAAAEGLLLPHCPEPSSEPAQLNGAQSGVANSASEEPEGAAVMPSDVRLNGIGVDPREGAVLDSMPARGTEVIVQPNAPLEAEGGPGPLQPDAIDQPGFPESSVPSTEADVQQPRRAALPILSEVMPTASKELSTSARTAPTAPDAAAPRPEGRETEVPGAEGLSRATDPSEALVKPVSATGAASRGGMEARKGADESLTERFGVESFRVDTGGDAGPRFAIAAEPNEANGAVAGQEPSSPLRSVTRGVVDQIAARMSEEAASGQTQLEIRLSPPELGTVRLHLVAKDEALTAEIQVESREIQAIVEAGLDDLKDQLGRQGVNVHSFEVSCQSDSHSGRSLAQSLQEVPDHGEPEPETAPARPDTPRGAASAIPGASRQRLNYLA